MKNKVYIRADASPNIGLGHIVRCFALAKMLEDCFSITFIVKHIPDDIQDNIESNDFSVSRINSEEEFLDMLTGSDIVVMDHYELDSSYQVRIKAKGSKLVCIDDMHDKEFFADLIINHSPGIYPQDYKVQSYTKLALGPEYALLRPAFLQAISNTNITEKVKNVLICFGGSDFKNLTKSVLEVVAKNTGFERISVILGSAYSYRASLNDLVSKYSNISILSSLDEDEVLAEIERADLSIIPASGILLEVIAGGAIPLICYYAENQRKLFNYFKTRNLLPNFDANNFNEEELSRIILAIQNKKINIHQIPFRKEIANAPMNNLNKFKELINE